MVSHSLSDSDLIWLAIGLLPLALIFFRITRFGVAAGMSLASLSTFTVWIGYHLTPWLSLRTDGWSSPLLRGSEVSEGIIFATICMFAIILGYGRHAALLDTKYISSYNLATAISRISNIPVFFSLLLALAAVVFAILSAGGVDELLSASRERAYDQWDELTVGRFLLSSLTRLSAVGGVIAAFIVAIRFGKTESRIYNTSLLMIVIVIGSANLLWSFSRSAGASLIFAALGLLFANKRKIYEILLSCFLVMSGIYLCLIGYCQRGLFLPGLLNFISAAISPDPRGIQLILSDTGTEFIIGYDVNLLNALDPWTAQIWFTPAVEDGLVENIVYFIMILNPIPSALLPYDVAVGNSLSTYLGTDGFVGLTTPAFAELYVLFGRGGAALVFILGRWMRHIDQGRERGDVIYFPIYLLFIFGFILGLHSGLRAMTRPIVYGIMLLLFRSLHQALRKTDKLEIIN